MCLGSFAWSLWSAWDDVSNVNAQCTCACGGTRAGGSTVRSAVAVGDEMAGSRFWRATRALVGPVVRQPSRQSSSPRALVRCRDVWASSDVTPLLLMSRMSGVVPSPRSIMAGQSCLLSWCCNWLS